MKIAKKKVSTLFALTLLILSLVFVNYNMTSSVQAATQAQIDNAIANGMAWLAAQQNPDGSWGTMLGWRVAKTGLAVLKFETHAIHKCIDPLNPGYQYYSQVRNGLDYIFANAHTMTISTQPAGNPDTDGDGIGVYFGNARTYETGIAMMAIGASTHPGMVVNVPGSVVNGWTYKDVLQDAVDYLAFGQNDAGTQRGGWGYQENDPMNWSDNSNSGYAVLGLAYAESPTIGGKTGFACKIPAFVRRELNIWINYIQNPVDGDTNDGGSGYNASGVWVNILKTGHLLFEMAFYGDTATTPRVRNAIDYLVRHWNDANDDPGWKGALGGTASYQAMFTTMKGLEILGIAVIDGIDWQTDFANVLVAQQNADGSWPPCLWDDGEKILATEWALLTLQKAVPYIPPGTLDLELYPREVVDLEDPTSTQWHELDPVKSRYYHLISWEPGKVLSPGDQIDMTPIDPVTREPIGLAEWFEVDDVTVDLVVNDTMRNIVYYLDYKCGKWTFDPYNPISTKWNEINAIPEEALVFGRTWHLTSWEDNGDGILSPCDYIDMTIMYPYPVPGEVVWFHVEDIKVTLKLTHKELHMPYYLESELSYYEFHPYQAKPVCTYWHEIYPWKSRWWHLSSWEDSRVLSPSDQIWLALKDPVTHELIPGTETEYHVDKLTVVMNITSARTRFVVMIGDSPAHAAPTYTYPSGNSYGGDPGRDAIMFTGDDLDYVPVINKIASEGITVFTVDYYTTSDAYTNFEYIATQTSGKHYNGTTAWDVSIANEIATRIGTGRGDLVFTYDLTASMAGSFKEIKTKTKAIIDALSGYDVKFGVGTHVDYPHNYTSYGYSNQYGDEDADWNGFGDIYGDYAWSMDTDLTDATTAKSVIQSVVPDTWTYWGGDGPQNYVRVLYECQYFSWRTSAFVPWRIVKFEGSLEQFKKYHWQEPMSTQWHEVNPDYCRQWHIIDWVDNGDGILSPCDNITMIDKETGELEKFHVETLSTDMWLTRKQWPPFYWKEPYPEYAPSGMPDFDERQDAWVHPVTKQWTWCGPTAVANSLWWMDSRFHSLNLITAYPGAVSEHDPSNVPPFIQHLAYLMDTDGNRTGLPKFGTNVFDMEAGIAQYLSWTGANPLGDCNGDGVVDIVDQLIVSKAFGSTPGTPNWNMAADIYPVTKGWPAQNLADSKVDPYDVALVAANMGKKGPFYEHTIPAPDFYYIEEEVERCEDVVLLIAPYDEMGYRYDEYAHFVTVAGVDSINMKIALSDPIRDAFETGLTPEGRVLPLGVPHNHPAVPPDPTHNNASLVSHDIYMVTDKYPCPGGPWSILNFPGAPPGTIMQIEYAVITSPIHDVAITDVKPAKTVVSNQTLVKVYVNATNEGAFTETFKVYAYYDDFVVPTPEQWDIFWSMGDVNRDGHINEIDLKIIMDNFGWIGPPGGNPADINMDGIVDMFDANICAKNQCLDIWTYFGLGVPPIGTQTVTNLLPGDTTTLTFTWNTTGFAKGVYTIKAIADTVPGETDLADNTYTDGTVRVTMEGDVTEEFGIIDIFDLVYVGSSLGAEKGKPPPPGTEPYKPNADLNCDGIIDIFDLVPVGVHLGEKDP